MRGRNSEGWGGDEHLVRERETGALRNVESQRKERKTMREPQMGRGLRAEKSLLKRERRLEGKTKRSVRKKGVLVARGHPLHWH